MTDSRKIIDRFFELLENHIENCQSSGAMNFIRRIETNKFATLEDRKRISELIIKFDKSCDCKHFYV